MSKGGPTIASKSQRSPRIEPKPHHSSCICPRCIREAGERHQRLREEAGFDEPPPLKRPCADCAKAEGRHEDKQLLMHYRCDACEVVHLRKSWLEREAEIDTFTHALGVAPFPRQGFAATAKHVLDLVARTERVSKELHERIREAREQERAEANRKVEAATKRTEVAERTTEAIKTRALAIADPCAVRGCALPASMCGHPKVA